MGRHHTSAKAFQLRAHRSKTHKRLKRTLFNWTKQDRTYKVSRKSSFSSYVQHKNRKQTVNSFSLCQLDAGRQAEGKGHKTDSLFRSFRINEEVITCNLPVKFKCKGRITSRCIRNRKRVMVVVSVRRFTSV